MHRLPVFLEKPAKCEVHGETMFFIWDDFQIALPISACVANMRACQRALDEWRVDESGKVEDIAHWRDHAASS